MVALQPTVTIRPIRLEDAEPFRELRIEAIRNHPLAFTADLSENEARPPEWWREQAAGCTGEGTNVIMLADAGERLAGMTGVWTPKTGKTTHVGIVWGVYVRPEFRGRGVCDGMLGACIDWARGKSLVTLKLSVVVGNDAARQCYELCGFTVYGVEPAAVRWEGKLHDEHLMALRL